MKNRYLNLDQFHKDPAVIGTKGDQPVQIAENAEEQLIVLASNVPEIRALGGADSRLVEFIITDESVDRMGDTISIKGWDVKSFKKNPVVLWAHSSYDPPVGKSVSLEIDKDAGQIRSVTEFTPKDLNPLGYMVYQMYVQRFMNATSVGFKPKEYSWVTESEDAGRAKQGGINFLKQELLEYSAVPVPANPNAVAVARSAGIDTLPLKQWAEKVLDEQSSRNLSADARQRVEILRAASSPTGRSLILEITDMNKADVKNDPPTPSPAPPTESVIKEVVTRRWDCGTEGHTHGEKSEAETCIGFDDHLDTLHKTCTELGVTIKAGRVLSKKNETALRAAVDQLNEVLSQLTNEEEDTNDKAASGETAVFVTEEPASVEDDGEMKIFADPAVLEAAVKSAVADSLKTITGRVD